MNGLPHYFIAIPLPDRWKDYFNGIQKEWRRKLPYKQWPHRDDLHITLKFLGAVSNEKRKMLEDELRVLENQKALVVQAGGIGYFGTPNSPRVLWGGVERTNQLQLLYDIVEESAVNVGFQRENRSYSPHITLAKHWQGGPDPASIKEMLESYQSRDDLKVTEVVMYRIHPGHSPKYEITSRYQLGEGY
ncbi:RNA 2',3'-cyclic phosphodiesterase [Virgibacillus sediminis]|uniref:RNA 2',3'-cyclic phosphodiesterase n=1 Tax=Virgibacillus sediminis TaxID=202260 RepID=A0ABV7A6Q8_9BACI